MRENDWNELEELLADGLPDLPPEEIVRSVTPWRRAMDRVLTGSALRAVTLSLFGLQYLLPALGTLLLLLGYRALRRENRWFRACFALAAAETAYSIPLLALNTSSVYAPQVLTPAVSQCLTVLEMGLLLTQFLCLWQGLRAVQGRAGLPPKANAALGIVAWYAALCLSARLGWQGWLWGIPMLAGYVFLFRSLFRLSRTLEEAGYVLHPAPVRLPDRWLALGLAAVLALGCLCGYRFGSRHPMDWQPRDAAETQGTEEIRARLLELGFPEEVLDDLSAEDLAACDGAIRVVADTIDLPMNKGRKVTTRTKSGHNTFIETTETVYDVKELHVTGVGVEVPGEHSTWVLFHHFRWQADPACRGTEALQLRPEGYGDRRYWSMTGSVTGRLLYDRDGETFTAPYACMESPGGEESYVVYAAYSLPQEGEDCRGYLRYTIEAAREGTSVADYLSFTHQLSWRQYPARTALAEQMRRSWLEPAAFRTSYDSLQFYPKPEGIELIG